MKALSGLSFAIVGKDFEGGKKEIEKKVTELGGTSSSKITAATAAVITTQGNQSSCSVVWFLEYQICSFQNLQ